MPENDPAPAADQQDPTPTPNPTGGTDPDPAQDGGTGDDPRVKKANAEAQRYRQQLRDEQAKNTSLLDNIAKALGLKPEDADPAELTKQLTASQEEAKQARIELAVFRAAAKAGGDADALLDSRGFLKAVAELDPTAADFGGQVETAVKSAVEANPKLAAAGTTTPPPPARSGTPVGGSPTPDDASKEPAQRARDYYAQTAQQ